MLDDIISDPGAELVSDTAHSTLGDSLIFTRAFFHAAKQETRQPKAATAINNADVIADNVLVLKQDIEVRVNYAVLRFCVKKV